MTAWHDARHGTWTVRALDGALVSAHAPDLHDTDVPALARLSAEPAAGAIVAATAKSYDCCSQTVTQGPGCCQITPENDFAGPSGAAEFTAARRLWPVSVT